MQVVYLNHIIKSEVWRRNHHLSLSQMLDLLKKKEEKETESVPSAFLL